MPEKKPATRGEGARAKQQLKANLSSSGFHFTQQRAAVFDFLRNVDHHPTAEEVYLAVKNQLPKVSLATVYKNLEALIAAGVASKLNYGDGSARYDIRTDHHHHARCVECGRMWDIEPTEHSAGLRKIKPARGFTVTDYRLELLGRCRDCRQ
ncbi:MAG: transcriptional repressor [Acidobacteria bacterium]|nr:transcriptional repressor [Acidobacteriota bacterium]